MRATQGPLAGWTFTTGDGSRATHAAVDLLTSLGAAPAAASPFAAGHMPEKTLELLTSRCPTWEDGWTASGSAYLTGRPTGPALAPPIDVAAAMAGAAAVFQALSRRLGKDLELNGPLLLGQRAATHDLSSRGGTSCGGNTKFLATADSSVVLNISRPSDADLLGAVIGRRPSDDHWASARESFASLTTAEVTRRAAEIGLACAAIGEAVDGSCSTESQVLSVEPNHGPPSRPPRVLDLSSLWAGPLAGALLAAIGADVIKVEHPERQDGTRRGSPSFFHLLNGAKNQSKLDLSIPSGRREFVRLIRWADLIIDNLRPRAFESLDIDPAELVTVSGPTTWLSISAYGQRGPNRNRVGYGDDTAVAGGLVLRDPSTGSLCFCGDAVADPIAGLHAAVALLAGYIGGGTRRVNLSLAGTVAYIVGRYGYGSTPPFDGLVLAFDRNRLPRPSVAAWQVPESNAQR